MVVLLPLLRPVRIVRVHDAVQRRHGHLPRMPLQGRVMLYAGMSAVLLGFTAALTVCDLERTAPHTTIHTFGDSVCWAVSTLSTATGLMGCGLGLLGAVAGSFSSWLMQAFSRRDDGGGPPGS